MAEWSKYGLAAGGASLATAVLGLFGWYMYRKHYQTDPASEWDDADPRLQALLGFHNPPPDYYPFEVGPKDGVKFTENLASICALHKKDGVKDRVLEVGCGPGGISFALSRVFEEVKGVDLSESFILKCKAVKETGEITYQIPVEGDILREVTYKVPEDIDRSKVTFELKDATKMELSSTGTFGCVVASNIIHHIPNPEAFILKMKKFVEPGGTFVLADFYRWEGHMAKKFWLGGYTDSEGKTVSTLETLQRLMKDDFELEEITDVPILARENRLTYRLMIDQVSVWRRKEK